MLRGFKSLIRHSVMSRVIVPMMARDFLLCGMLSGLGRRCQCFFGSGSPMSTLFPFWVANIVIGRRCLGELSAMYADIGNLIGLFAEEAVGIRLDSTSRLYDRSPLPSLLTSNREIE